MKKKRLKLSNKWFRIILIPILTLLLLIGTGITVITSMLSTTLDTYLGKGESYVEAAKGTELWDSFYYTKAYSDAAEAKAAAYNVAESVAKEGTVLLKNNGKLPLPAGSKVMPFGKAYLDPEYGQKTSGGSAKWVIAPITPEQGLADFDINTSAARAMTEVGEPEALTEAKGTLVAGEAATILGGDSRIYEYDPSIYRSIEPVEDTTGLVFISRRGQEGQDMKYDAYADGTPHYLALSQNEQDTIREAKRITGHVVVVLVTSAPMELAPIQSGELEADGIVWMGHPGERGFSILSDFLTGKINPSGRTVDIYPVDFTADPTYQSVGVFTYSNATTEKAGYTGDSVETYNRMYVEYQEGVYMGYRYYETADKEDASFVYGTLDKNGGVAQAGAVAYPFGYGLSYTTFQQEIVETKEEGNMISVTVKVTNTGNQTGKEVVQLYYTAPYTELDKEYQIEKPVVNLIAFDKTKELQPAESQNVTLTFNKEEMASYSYKHQNSNGTIGAYMLEAGDYTLSLRANSHDVIAETSIRQGETIWYDGSDENHIRQSEKDAQSILDENGNPTGQPKNKEGFVAASNQFQISSDYMNSDSVILSRKDWIGTQPKAADNRSKKISDNYLSLLGKESSFDVENDPELGNVKGSYVYSDEMPVSNADNGLVLSNLRGLAYDDPKWDELLDQIDWEKDKNGILMNFAGAAYATGAIDSIGLPATQEYDGANGLKVPISGGYDMTQSSSFGFPPLMAATWNTELMYQVGEALGQEALMHGINGWYAPGVNLHRSPFSGRVFEYYSEDPVLSGMIAEHVISGAGNQGMFSYIKHFVMNETETGRAELSNYWADEQTMREVYMKAFEIPIHRARMTLKYTTDDKGNTATKVVRAATAVMPAQNGVGMIVGEANYPLITNVLRGEWGFEGVTVTDYWVWGKDNFRDLSLRAGTDTYLSNYMPQMWNITDYDSATARSVMRNAIHNLSYTVANSNAMQGVSPGSVVKVKISPWRYGIYALDGVLIILIGLGIYWIIRRSKHEKTHPELYKRKVKKSA